MYGVFILHQTPPAEIKDRPSQGGIHALKAKCPPHCMLMKHNEWPHGPRTCSQIIAPLIPHKLIQTPHKSLRVETGLCNGSLSIKEHHKNILYDLINLCQLIIYLMSIFFSKKSSTFKQERIELNHHSIYKPFINHFL